MINEDIIKLVPKVELHDHLDGGLRPATVIELAREDGVQLPTYDEAELTKWFTAGYAGNLAHYLELFSLAVGVMQTKEALERTAFEAMEDYARENVVYAEVRFAPVLHTQKGLNLEEIVTSVLNGLERGRKKTGVHYGLILCAMRNQSPQLSLEMAELAVAFRTRGVVGFDIAGDESGHPPKRHIQAFQYIRSRNFNITIHAGEGFGLESIWQALQICGAHRIGHGTHIVDDMTIEGDQITKMGDLSHFIQDKRIPLEMCIQSNIDTGAVKSYESHPFIILLRNNFRVFLCSDNRTISNTNLTQEMIKASRAYDLSFKDLEKISVNAMKSAFIHQPEKLDLIFNTIKRQFTELRSKYKLD